MENENQAQNIGESDNKDCQSLNRTPRKSQKNDKTIAQKNRNSNLAGCIVSPESHNQSDLFIRFISRKIKKYTEEEFDAIGGESKGRVLKQETDYFYNTVMSLENVNGTTLPNYFDVHEANHEDLTIFQQHYRHLVVDNFSSIPTIQV